ncbi:hypothetical protein TNCV_3831491 [Trichonephila clavipes]|nr:hypothetical protein TNCV_3831491 [Trichonephila clavipes]
MRDAFTVSKQCTALENVRVLIRASLLISASEVLSEEVVEKSTTSSDQKQNFLQNLTHNKTYLAQEREKMKRRVMHVKYCRELKRPPVRELS